MDHAIMEYFQGAVQHSSPLTHFMYGITMISDAGLIWILLAVGLMLFPRTRPLGVAISAALLCMLVLNNLAIKTLIARPRPYDSYPIEVLIPKLRSYSFPSGHSASSFAAAVCVAYYSRKWGIPALIMAALIAFSRVYFSVHYLSDVVGGALSGSLYACIGLVYAKKLWPKHYAVLISRFTRKSR